MMTMRPSVPAPTAPSRPAAALVRGGAWRAARATLGEVLARAANVSLDEDDGPGARDPFAVVLELRTLIEQTLEQLRVLDVPPGDAGDDTPTHPVQDLCFAGFIELKQVLRELGAREQKDDRAVAVETARRKICRVVHAVLLASADPSDPVDLTIARASLESSFAVRRLYATFRRSLRRPADESPGAVLDAVRYAVSALALLVSSPAYRDVRAQDRHILRGLRERALNWARHDKSSQEGQRLLGDVGTCADLLRAINRRQELQNHDAALLSELVAAPTGDPGWWARLLELEGLDDELDVLIARSNAGPRDETVFIRLVARLTALASRVHDAAG